MLNFLRRIRRNKINGKYFKYAIGEIVLVVVGILIALSINNWNEGRKQRIQATNYLESLVKDLRQDSTEYQVTLEMYRTDIRNNSQIFLNPEYYHFPLDSLVVFIDQYYMVDRLTDQTYQKIKNSGLSDLLGTQEINASVNNYYSFTVSHVKGYFDFDKEWTNKEGDFWYNNPNYETHGSDVISNSLPFMQSDATRKKELIKLINSTPGRNNLRNGINRKELGINLLEKSLEKASDLIQKIEAHLAK